MRAFRQSAYLFSLPFLLSGCTETGLEPRLEEPIPAPTYAALSVGYEHACALDVDGRAFCWGSNEAGELGDGSTVDRDAPTPVATGLRFAAIEAGWRFTCALTDAGALHCWGATPMAGQRLLPVAVGPAGITWRSIESGLHHYLCGVTTENAGYCTTWNGGNFELAEPWPGMQWTSLSSGSEHACGVTTGGAGFCWGFNWFGQLGVPWNQPAAGLRPAPGDDTWAELVAGNEYTCGTTTEGRTQCWGIPARMALGRGGFTADELWEGIPQPVAVFGGDLTVTGIDAAEGWSADPWYDVRRATCGFAEIGRTSVVCWGDGQGPTNIGHGRFAWTTVELGDRFGCGLTTDGRILCWDPIAVIEEIAPFMIEATRLVYPDISFDELPAPVVEWRDA